MIEYGYISILFNSIIVFVICFIFLFLLYQNYGYYSVYDKEELLELTVVYNFRQVLFWNIRPIVIYVPLQTIAINPEDWIIVSNHHKAIIDKNIYCDVQNMLNRKEGYRNNNFNLSLPPKDILDKLPTEDEINLYLDIEGDENDE